MCLLKSRDEQASCYQGHVVQCKPDSLLLVLGREKVFTRGGGLQKAKCSGLFPCLVAQGDRVPAQNGVEHRCYTGQILREAGEEEMGSRGAFFLQSSLEQRGSLPIADLWPSFPSLDHRLDVEGPHASDTGSFGRGLQTHPQCPHTAVVPAASTPCGSQTSGRRPNFDKMPEYFIIACSEQF